MDVLEKQSIFCGRKCMGGLGGTRTSNLIMTNALSFEVWTIKTICFLPHVFLILTVVKKIYRMFICGIVIQNDTCALATASYFWLMMNGCSWVIVIFCDKNVSLQVVSIQNLRIHAKCSAIWSGFTCPCARQNKECPEHNVTTTGAQL